MNVESYGACVAIVVEVVTEIAFTHGVTETPCLMLMAIRCPLILEKKTHQLR